MSVTSEIKHSVAQYECSQLACDASFDLTIFAWAFGLATLFQLARGDMGLFAFLRNTPNGTSWGDGIVPQMWFRTALIALVWPRRGALLLLAAAGTYDVWWRLPIVTPSIFFHGLISAQVLVTAVALCVSRRTLRIKSAEFMERFRMSALLLVCVLFGFAAFHKLTITGVYWTSGFFDLLAHYYVLFLPLAKVPAYVHWAMTVVGESLIFVTFFFQRTRPIAIPLCIAFACFVGTAVYGFGAILLAVALALSSNRMLLDPIRQMRITRLLEARVGYPVLRVVFAVVIAIVFMADHWSGFTLADRPRLFALEDAPTTADVLTPMQIVWFFITTSILISSCVAFRRHGAAIASNVRVTWTVPAVALAALFALSEVGLYAGLKDRPNVAMFSGLRVRGKEPNHFIVRDRLLNSYFYQDLLLVLPPGAETRIGIPRTSLKARLDRARRVGVDDELVEIYRAGEISRLWRGAELRFDFAQIDQMAPSLPLERLFTRRLFLIEPVTEPDLRYSMPELFQTQNHAPNRQGQPGMPRDNLATEVDRASQRTDEFK